MVGSVAVLLADGFADWECAYVTGVGGPFYDVETKIVSPKGAALVSQGGMAVTPDGAFEDVRPDQFDLLLICGGMHWQSPVPTDVAKTAHAFLENDRHLAAICAGTLPLARAGILDSCLHTSNARDFLMKGAPAYRGHEHYVDAPTVRDGLVITAPGSAPASFTAEIFRAVGLEEAKVVEFLGMLGAEFG